MGQLIIATEGRLKELFNKLTDEHMKDPYYQMELKSLSEMMDKMIKKLEQ
jgi:hypothetical protein